MPKASKKEQTPKAAAASKRNLENWEKTQETIAMVKDNDKVLTVGFVIGFVTCFIAAVIAFGLLYGA